MTTLLVATITMPVQNIVEVPLWTGRGFEDWRYIFVFMALGALGGPLVLAPVLWVRHRALFRLQRGQSVDPVEVWKAAVTKVPMTSIVSAALWGPIVIFGGIAWVGHHEAFSRGMYVAAAIPQFMMLIGSAAFYLVLYEVAWLPFARQVAPDLPPDFVDDSGLSVRRRLVLITTASTFTIGCEAAGLAMGFEDRGVRIWIVVLGTVGLVATYLGLLLALLQFGFTRRVDELSRSIGSIGLGRAKFHVYPTSGDEFDAVGRALNRTVDLLDEHSRGLQESRSRLVAVADETRRRTERDLHDGAQQHVAMVSVQLALLARRAADRPAVVDSVARMRAELGEALDELRSLAHGIYPVALEHEGLVAALTAAGRQSHVPVVVDAAADVGRWARDVESAFYFCCWELIQAVARGGGSDRPVHVDLAERNGVLSIAIDAPLPAELHDRPTVLFLEDRIGAIGGEVWIDASPDRFVAHGAVRVS